MAAATTNGRERSGVMMTTGANLKERIGEPQSGRGCCPCNVHLTLSLRPRGKRTNAYDDWWWELRLGVKRNDRNCGSYEGTARRQPELPASGATRDLRQA